MTEELDGGRPAEGDLVRMRGLPDGQVMWVTCPALSEAHGHEGVKNGILCEWDTDGEPHFDVFQPGQLEIIQRADSKDRA